VKASLDLILRTGALAIAGTFFLYLLLLLVLAYLVT